LLSEKHPTPIERVGIRDVFGKSGDAKDLMIRYNLTPKDIAESAKKAIKMRK
jgi:transketolase